MKQITLFALAAMLMGGCDHSHNNAPSAVVKTDSLTQEFYGQQFNLAPAIPVGMLVSNMEGKDTLETVIEGVIDQTCPNAGCWLNVKMDNGEVLKVTTDHVFFVPVSGCEGLKCKVAGKAYQYERSVDDQKHYAMEEGQTEEQIAMITAPKKLMAFTATGVMIEGYEEPADGSAQHPASCNHDHKPGESHDEHEGHEHHEEGVVN